MLISLALSLAAAASPATGQDTRAPLLIDRNRIDRPKLPQPPTPTPVRPAPTSVAAEASGVKITGIRFIGSKAPGPVAEAARPFVGKPADKATLQALAAGLSAAYAHADVALYTVAIPAQDFAGGTVSVRLTEATIVSAAVKSDGPKTHPRLRERMARMMRETPLSRSTFERQLTLMRAIPGLTIDPQLTDPRGTGQLNLLVTPKQKHSKFSAGFSNRGIDLLGDGQFDARADLYSLLNNGDQLTVAGSAARDFKRYRYVSGAYSTLIGSDGLTLSGNAAYLETRPRGTVLTGNAKQAGLALSYPWLRDFHHAGDVSVALDGINSDNAVFGNIVATERTRAARVSASYTASSTKRSVSVAGSLSQGLTTLGARTGGLSDTDFTKATVAAGVAQAIGKRAALRVNASGQYSRSALPAAERYAVGGEAIGRAFDTGLITGDKGAGGLIELAYRPVKGARFSTSEVYGFVDGAVVGVRPRGPYLGADYSLASAGVGGRLRFRDKAELGLEASHSIDDPYRGYDDDWRVNLAWRLSL